MNKNCIVIFIKYPETGKVKTRLAESIGIDNACNLYKCFVKDLINTLILTKTNFRFAYDTNHSEQDFINWLGAQHNYFRQRGNDLGEKMKNAFIDTFAMGFENVVLIGSDIPDLPVNIFDNAFINLDYDSKLSENNGSVIGPAFDGGYYLIGFNKNRFLPDIFNNIKWSTSEVYKTTIDIFNQFNHPVYELTKWNDIDTIKDLKFLSENNQNKDFYYSNTMNFIRDNIFNENINNNTRI